MERRAQERKEKHQALIEFKEQKRLDAIREQEEEEERERVEEERRANAQRAHLEEVAKWRLAVVARTHAAIKHYGVHLKHHAFIGFLRLISERSNLGAIANNYYRAFLGHIVLDSWRDHIERQKVEEALIGKAQMMMASRQYALKTLRYAWTWLTWGTLVARDGLEQEKHMEMWKLQVFMRAWGLK